MSMLLICEMKVNDLLFYYTWNQYGEIAERVKSISRIYLP